MNKLLLLPLFGGIMITAAFGQANTKFNLVNDAYYGYPTIEGLKLRMQLGILFENPENEGYYHMHLGRVIGPTGLRTEFFVSDRIGIGTDAIYNYTSGQFSRHEVEFNSLTGDDTTIHVYTFTNNHVRIQGRINFHKRVKSKKLDVYTGLGFGSNANIVKMTRDKQEVQPADFIRPTRLKVSARACFGFRWYPAKPIGINFEIGIGGPLVSAGASSRLAFKLPKAPELSNPRDSENLEKKKNDLQEKQKFEEEQEKLKEKNSSLEKEKQELEEEKLKLEQEKLELERQKLELEKEKFEEEKKENKKKP